MHDNKVDQRLWGVKAEMFLCAVGRKSHTISNPERILKTV